jgi:hypothetical protein
MMTDIRELLTAIRAWEAADNAYYIAYDAWVNSTPETRAEARELIHTTDKQRMFALQALQGEWMDTANKFVALADHVDAQAAKIAAALAIETAHPDTISAALNNVPMAVGWNEARDEFRAALTGNDGGDA